MSDGVYLARHSFIAVLLDYLNYGFVEARFQDGQLVYEFIDHDGQAAEHEAAFWNGAGVADARQFLESNRRVQRERWLAMNQAKKQEKK